MLPAFKRFLALLLVFLIFFLSVTALRTWRAGGDLGSLLPDFLRKNDLARSESFTPSASPALNLSDVEMISRLNEEYARLTKAVVPSVVSIDTSGIRTERMMNVWGESRTKSYASQGQGSGVIVSKEGHIITNHHVIAGQNNQIRVTLHSGKTYDAELIGEDSLLDIAVIKIERKEPFIPLKLGDSSQVEVGQLVFAVGNPFGLGETVTQGIISAKERSISDNQRNLFQTDAAINPGNSGGPLVNLTGEIIGINAAISTVDKDKPGFLGVGFSIPSNDVKEALEQIIARGRPIRGYLGVQMRDLNSSIRAELNYTGETGTAVTGVTPEAPADKAGLQQNDIMIAYDGEAIRDIAQLIAMVQRTKIGKEVKLTVWRAGETLELSAKITEATKPPEIIFSPTNQEARDNAEILKSVGVEVRDLSSSEHLQGFRGVVVTSVLPGRLGEGTLEEGDLIRALNNSPITSSTEFYLHLAASAAVQSTSLHVIRQGKPLLVNLPAPQQ
ncbi:MAG: trypsin-like peptidase domain-containing protein [Luteolibacter sp.]